MLKEFKEFIMTGNVVEFAVAVIMAGVIGAVVTGFVEDIIMPIVGSFTGGVDFADKMYWITPQVVGEDGALTGGSAIRWGKWLNTIINLIITGFVMFMIVKSYNKMKAPPEAAAPAGPSQEDLLAEIRDLLKK